VHETFLGATPELVFTVWPFSLKRLHLGSREICEIAASMPGTFPQALMESVFFAIQTTRMSAFKLSMLPLAPVGQSVIHEAPTAALNGRLRVTLWPLIGHELRKNKRSEARA
jgi:hypothetical protein